MIRNRDLKAADLATSCSSSGRATALSPASLARSRPRALLPKIAGATRVRVGFSSSVIAWLLFLCFPCDGVGAIEPPRDALNHWAFQERRIVSPPQLSEDTWSKTGVDRFILARLREAGLRPAPGADPRALVRRMTFGLLGLPPSTSEVEQFLAEAVRDHSAAVDRLIERLLASPRYGERWARHWLDLARYSDTKGYVYAREERRFVHAPTYRDWVIRAFNQDLPYDRFLLLQMAADQLTPERSPDRAAMGFLTGGRRFLGVTHDIIDDRIDVVTRGTMALTVQCARCHDHKYDPIPTADYYSLYGVFHGADDRLVLLGDPQDEELSRRQVKLAETMDRRREEAAARLRARVGDYLAAQLELAKYPDEQFGQILTTDDIIPALVRRWRDFLHTTAEPGHPIFGPWAVLAEVPAEEFAAAAPAVLARLVEAGKLNSLVREVFSDPPQSMGDVAHRYGIAFERAQRDPDLPGASQLRAFLSDPDSPAQLPSTGIVNNEIFFPTSVTEELWKLQGEVDRRLIELGVPAALMLVDHAPEPNPRIFERGDPARPGLEVPRRFLGLISSPDRRPFEQGSGRLELARAIASADNPLTARVMVNRIWQAHFGTGLVRTPSDFGTRAEPPSHPGLLDWLANRFIADGWSVKSLHRLILASAVYQQASNVTGSAGHGSVADRDPDNRFLSSFPMRRLDFEEARDAMLLVSGELDLTMGGKPLALLDAGNQRRTVYAEVDRQFLPGVLRTFDFANPDIHVAVRHETTVPQQALFFLNNRFAADRARALVRHCGELAPEARVQALHQAVYQRESTGVETESALRFIAAAQAAAPVASAPPPETQWRYGTGEYDRANGRLRSFTPLPHFTGVAWQGAPSFPGGSTGWAQLTAQGGHPGNTRAQACVRRWVAPRSMTVNIRGLLRHEPDPGDGIRAFIVSSRAGELKAASVHHASVEMSVEGVQAEAGDTLDFIVDIDEILNSDQFLWEPSIVGEDERWDAAKQFAGPLPALDYLTPWEQYAQVLLLANEFVFLD